MLRRSLECDSSRPYYPALRGNNSGRSIQQLTGSVGQMQTLAPWQGSPEWSFQILRITSCSEVCARWMFSFPPMTDKIRYLVSQGWGLRVTRYALRDPLRPLGMFP